MAAAVLVFTASCTKPSGIESSSSSLEALAPRLASPDWRERRETLLALKSHLPSANSLCVTALADKSDAVSLAAQVLLVEQGGAVIAFLVGELVRVPEDRGLYASIGGGLERSRGKSLAGTLWLAVVKIPDLEKRGAALEELAGHPSERVRAVAAFTAASLREAAALRVIERLAGDPHPLVRAKCCEALLRLMQHKTKDAELEGRMVDLLIPQIVPIANSTAPHFHDPGWPYGAMMEKFRVGYPENRERWRERLLAALGDPSLSPSGIACAMAAALHHSQKEDVEVLYRRWCDVCGSRADADREGEEFRRALTVLSAFPSEVFEPADIPSLAEACRRFFERDPSFDRLPHLVGRLLLAAGRSEDPAALESLLALCGALFDAPDEAVAKETCLAFAEILPRKGTQDPEPQKEETAARLKEILAPRAGRIAALAASEKSLILKIAALDLLVAIEDRRALEVFERAWEHRHPRNLGEGFLLSHAFRRNLTGLGRMDPGRISRQCLDYIVAEPEARDVSTELRDLCIACMIQRPDRWETQDLIPRPEVFDALLKALADPEEHPRARACLVFLAEFPGLSDDQRRRLADLLMELCQPPHDANLRSKAMLALAEAGDRRVIPYLHRMMMEEEHPGWCYQNIFAALQYLNGDPEKAGEAVTPARKKAFAEEMVGHLENLLARWPRRAPRRQFCYPNVYFEWGISCYAYIPAHAIEHLKEYTGQKFGADIPRWRQWLAETTDWTSPALKETDQ